jgi:hypothetical protein
MPELLCHIGREARTGYDYIRIVSYPKREGGALLRAISDKVFEMRTPPPSMMQIRGNENLFGQATLVDFSMQLNTQIA